MGIIRGKPRIHKKPEAEYIYIYIHLCVILHSNHSMRMLRYHMVDHLPWLVKVDRKSESWQCSMARAQGR